MQDRGRDLVLESGVPVSLLRGIGHFDFNSFFRAYKVLRSQFESVLVQCHFVPLGVVIASWWWQWELRKP